MNPVTPAEIGAAIVNVDPSTDQKEVVLEKKVTFWTRIAATAVSLFQIVFSALRK